MDQIDYFINLPTSRLYVNNEEITENRVITNFGEIKKSISFYREYLDIFIDDVIKEPGNTFEFKDIQRVMLRAFARHRYTFGTFNRGFSKSFIAILFELLICILYPRNRSFLTTETDEQGTKIADQKLSELLELFPRLKQELEVSSRGKLYESGRDHIKVRFKNKSTFEVVGNRVSNLGMRFQQGFIEEAATIDGDKLARVIIPMMNVDRTVRGKVDKSEVRKRQIFLTSAGFKNTFAYDKLMQILMWQTIKDDDTAFYFGGSYELAEKIGLLDKGFRQELQEDATFNEQIFDREYGSQWSGTMDGSFFDADQFDKLRKLNKPTFSSDMDGNMKTGAYYIISMDVGRLNDRSVVCVFRIFPNPGGVSDKSLVYIDQYDQEHFEIQCIKVKELVAKYNAQVLVIDANGIGSGLVDYLVRPTRDLDGSDMGDIGRPYSVLNDERYDKYKMDDSIPMIYNIKGNAELNNAIAVNTLTQMSSNKVKFLIDEKLARTNMAKEEEANKKPFSAVERAKRLKPHILTSHLKEEMLNLRRKRNNDINVLVSLEQVNRKMHKDKYSAFSYGLYWIKITDDSRVKRKQSNKFKASMFYTSSRDWEAKFKI